MQSSTHIYRGLAVLAGLISIAGNHLTAALIPVPPTIESGLPPALAPPSMRQSVLVPFNQALPTSTRAAVGQNFTLGLVVPQTPGTTFQWIRNGQTLVNRTQSSLNFNRLTFGNAGSYQVAVTTAQGTTTTDPFELLVLPISRFSNISTRAKSIAGGGELVTGFVVEGSGKLPLLLRAVAPTLAAAPFNLIGTINDPTLRLSFNQDFLESYDNWGETSDPENLSAAAQRIGAFPLNSGSLDTAALREYAPGVYTARLEEKQGASGIALLELYDATDGQSSAQLTNISSRAVVGSGDDVLVPGVVIAGDAPLRVLIRAVGPTLTTYGVTNVLADPQFSVLRDGETVGSNNDWELFPRRDELVAASSEAGAFALEEDSKDAAAILTLEPGVYTVLVSGVGDTTGQALVELYKLKN